MGRHPARVGAAPGWRTGRLAPRAVDPVVPDAADLTTLLRRWSAGEREALDQLFPVLYDRMRRLARHGAVGASSLQAATNASAAAPARGHKRASSERDIRPPRLTCRSWVYGAVVPRTAAKIPAGPAHDESRRGWMPPRAGPGSGRTKEGTEGTEGDRRLARRVTLWGRVARGRGSLTEGTSGFSG